MPLEQRPYKCPTGNRAQTSVLAEELGELPEALSAYHVVLAVQAFARCGLASALCAAWTAPLRREPYLAQAVRLRHAGIRS